jgi:hypothetical protein
MVALICNPSYSWKQEDCKFKPAQAKAGRTCLKNKIQAGGVTQVVECLPSKYEALSPSPNTKKKKKRERERERKEKKEKEKEKQKDWELDSRVEHLCDTLGSIPST